MRRGLRIFPALCLMALVLAGCGQLQPNPTAPNYSGAQGPYGNQWSSVLGDDAMSFGTAKQGPGQQGGGSGGSSLGVNAYLWRGALDTLSFMPLASADPFGGVIITDWYTPPTSTGERFKATAYVLGRELRSDGVRVSVFRQVLQNGQWVDAPVSSVTVNDIENKVLARARQLRAQAQASNG